MVRGGRKRGKEGMTKNEGKAVRNNSKRQVNGKGSELEGKKQKELEGNGK